MVVVRRRRRRARRPARGRSSSPRRRRPPSATRSGTMSTYALQAGAARDRRRGRGRRRGAPRRRRRGARPQRRRPARRIGAAPRAPRRAPPRRGRDRARSRSTPSTRATSAGSCATTRGIVDRIVERKDATEEELAVTEINSGLYAFDAVWLRRPDRLAQAVAEDRRALPDRARRARPRRRPRRGRADRRRRRPAARDQRPGRAGPGRVGHADADQRRPHDRAGVTMRDPSTVYVDAGVALATDVTIEPNVILRGATSVGEGTSRRARAARSYDSAIGAGCTVWASVVESSTIEDGAKVGPFSHLRPGSRRGPRRGGRQLRRAEERPPRARA